MKRFWKYYCTYVVLTMYVVFYFGTMILTLRSATGDRALRSMLRYTAEVAAEEVRE